VDSGAVLLHAAYSGYDIAIEGVAREAGGAEVLVATTAPGDDCFTTQAITEPVVMVRVGAVAGLIRLHEHAETLTRGFSRTNDGRRDRS
jgi:hypothetical protein